ncbi:hypothetical protein K7432_007427 [Basidiobolus ranarum]|uniref:Kinase-like protein n=1 Tax=Basidiobolus ranarum TaxID=34480 RepID=A0ABR2WTH8_9FUNG
MGNKSSKTNEIQFPELFDPNYQPPCGSALGQQFDHTVEPNLFQYDLLKSLGRGAFGKVMVVRSKRDGKLYALKYISKSQCVKQKAVRNILSERRILERVDHPFVCNLQCAFQDDEHMYLLLDLMLGGDLRFHLDRIGHFTEEAVRFHISEISSGLNYLHKHNIIHRDIKPDNVLLDQWGHCHLTDFNSSGRIRSGKPCKSVIGTHSYMAPEMIQKRGYNQSVDWWSLGVLMFECLYGKLPFRGRTNQKTNEAIISGQIMFPKKCPQEISLECYAAVLGFLQCDIQKRLGCGENKIRNHPFLDSIDWDALEAKQIQPPFKPEIKLIASDTLTQLEEVLFEEPPLTHKSSKRSLKLPKPGSPMDVIRSEFKVFNREVYIDPRDSTPL